MTQRPRDERFPGCAPISTINRETLTEAGTLSGGVAVLSEWIVDSGSLRHQVDRNRAPKSDERRLKRHGVPSAEIRHCDVRLTLGTYANVNARDASVSVRPARSFVGFWRKIFGAGDQT